MMAARRQHGAALVIALVMLAVVLLLGTATASLLMLDQHAARNHRAHLHAMQAAQAALDDAYEEVCNGTRLDPAAFPAKPGCRDDAAGRGLCRAAANDLAWTSQQLTKPGAGAAGYGEFTGNHIRLDGITPPRYLVELLPSAAPSASGDADDDRDMRYRISAAGFGHGDTQAGLQAIVSRYAGPGNRIECRRLAWRLLPLS